MPLFEYIVRTEEGKRLEGSIEARTLNEANNNLLKKKYTIVKLSEKEVVFDFLGPFLDRLSLEVEKMKNKVPLTTLVFFTRQLSTMFSAGLTLEKSIFQKINGVILSFIKEFLIEPTTILATKAGLQFMK